MGKGSKPRPMSIPIKQYEENWERIFGKKEDKKEEQDKEEKKELNYKI